MMCEECGGTTTYGLRICKRCRAVPREGFAPLHVEPAPFQGDCKTGERCLRWPPPESKALDQIWIHSQRRHPPKSREEFKMTGDYDAKRFTEGLVRIANKYGYRMKQFVSSTHRVLVNDADETLEIQFLGAREK